MSRGRLVYLLVVSALVGCAIAAAFTTELKDHQEEAQREEQADRQERQARAEWRSYSNQLGACRRGNPLRRVVFRNTSNAIEQSEQIGDPPHITAIFETNLELLLSVEGIDPETGAIDCLEVLRRPKVPRPQGGPSGERE